MQKHKEEHKRFRGVDWYKGIQDTAVILVGLGGIGSPLAVSLSKALVGTLVVYDHDKVEKHNTGCQMYSDKQIGEYKTAATKDNITRYSAGNLKNFHSFNNEFTDGSMQGKVMISAVDKMPVREVIFNRWLESCKNLQDTSDCLFIDGRMEAEFFQVFCIKYNKEDTEFYRSTLFDDTKMQNERNDVSCTNLQTSHFGQGISFFITNMLSNFVSNLEMGFDMRKVHRYSRYDGYTGQFLHKLI